MHSFKNEIAPTKSLEEVYQSGLDTLAKDIKKDNKPLQSIKHPRSFWSYFSWLLFWKRPKLSEEAMETSASFTGNKELKK